LLQILVEQLQQAIPNAQRGAVLLQDELGELLLKAHWPPGKHSVSKTLAEQASAERAAFIWTMSDERNANTPLSVLHYHVESAIYAPLLWEDQVLGVVYVDNYGLRQAFTPADVELLRAIANQTAMFVKNHALKQELQREAAIRSNLLRQFSPKLAERLWQDRERLWLGGKRVKPVTILILDIRGFTPLAAQMAPDDVVEMLNEMLGVCVPIIFEYDGMVDKYVGDSIVAVFGSPEPDHQQWAKAVQAAIEIQQAIHELGNERQSRYLPIYQVGIGIHSGEVVHGFIGSPERMEYTVVGDTVNWAARCCDGADKGEIVISRAVYEHVYRLVKVLPKTIKSKHREIEPDLAAYIVKGLKENVV
jgi:adenylate cyclase